MADPFSTHEFLRPTLTTAMIKRPEVSDTTLEEAVQKYGEHGYRLTTATPIIGHGGTTDYMLFTFELNLNDA